MTPCSFLSSYGLAAVAWSLCLQGGPRRMVPNNWPVNTGNHLQLHSPKYLIFIITSTCKEWLSGSWFVATRNPPPLAKINESLDVSLSECVMRCYEWWAVRKLLGVVNEWRVILNVKQYVNWHLKTNTKCVAPKFLTVFLFRVLIFTEWWLTRLINI
jgi:hypothetical protein